MKIASLVEPNLTFSGAERANVDAVDTAAAEINCLAMPPPTSGWHPATRRLDVALLLKRSRVLSPPQNHEVFPRSKAPDPFLGAKPLDCTIVTARQLIRPCLMAQSRMMIGGGEKAEGG